MSLAKMADAADVLVADSRADYVLLYYPHGIAHSPCHFISNRFDRQQVINILATQVQRSHDYMPVEELVETLNHINDD